MASPQATEGQSSARVSRDIHVIPSVDAAVTCKACDAQRCRPSRARTSPPIVFSRSPFHPQSPHRSRNVAATQCSAMQNCLLPAAARSAPSRHRGPSILAAKARTRTPLTATTSLPTNAGHGLTDIPHRLPSPPFLRSMVLPYFHFFRLACRTRFHYTPTQRIHNLKYYLHTDAQHYLR